MNMAFKRVFSLFICFVMLLFSAIPVLAGGINAGAKGGIARSVFQITSKTEDCAIRVGDDLTLMADASQAVSSYKWELSTDGGTSWVQISTASVYDITDAAANTPANVAYQYRITMKSSSDSTCSGIIRVLVSDEHSYRTISLRNDSTKVSAYMHDDTRVVLTPLSDGSADALTLAAALPSDHLPLIICDISLVNRNNQVVPYLGSVNVEFPVGSAYDGNTLNAYQLTGGNIVTYSGIVTDGVLSVTANSPSPFMVGIPAEGARTVTVNHGAGGTIMPSGNVNTPDGSDKTFTFLPDAGYTIDAVTVDGADVTVTGNTYTLANITQNHTVSVSFRAITTSAALHTIIINAPAHGSVYPSGDITVLHGSAQTVYFYPEAGYELDTVTVNGTEVNVIGNSYTVSAVTEDSDIIVSFRPGTTQLPDIRKTISSSAGPHGSISPMGDVSVEYGGEMYFYFIPYSGYEVDKVKVDNVEVAVSGNFYRFVNVIGDHTINFTFKLIPAPPTYYTVTATAGTGGSISPSGDSSILKNGSQTFTFIPSSGYEIDTVTVDGTPVSVTGNAYTLTDVTANHTINVTFKRIIVPPTYYTVTATAGTGGIISPSGSVQVLKNGSQAFVFTPDSGYEIGTVTVDGAPVSVTGNAYTLTDVTANHTVNGTFKKIITVTASAGTGGSITPSGAVRVAENGSQAFVFTPDSGYEIDSVTVDGTAVSVTGNAYTLTDVTANHTVNVTFKKLITPTPPPTTAYFTITATAGEGGSISPSGSVQVTENGSRFFVITHDADYAIDVVTVDGVAVSIFGGAYTFTDVKANHTVNVTFKKLITPTPPPTSYFTITATAGTGGSVAPSGDVQVAESGSQTFVFTPDDGYEINSVTVDGTVVNITDNAYTLANVTSNRTVNVIFEQTVIPAPPVTYYTITATAGEGGRISPAGNPEIAEGRDFYFDFIPNEGYEIDTVTVDGAVTAITENSYRFESVTADHSIQVTFRKIAAAPVFHTVTVSVGSNGSVSPSGMLQVEDGSSQTFSLTADEGYETDAVFLNGEKKSVTDNRFTIEEITEDIQLSVTFKAVAAPVAVDTEHCFVCGWFGRNVAPWCWLAPLIIVVPVGGVLFFLVKRRK